ncbi:MAG: protein-L-isoaspartate(D-aspartate) O-methyltransferase [Cyclobacteriaceae bacterium]
MPVEDSYRHKGMRRQLVNKVRSKGITDEKVLAAIGRVPRHAFLDKAFLEHAYQDKAFQIGEGQTISQPYTVAFQSQLLEVEAGDRILEIGTGSGYQCSVLLEMGAKVYSIEYNWVLHRRAIKTLQTMGYEAHLFHGDGTKGLPSFAPYNGIIVTAGAPVIPLRLLEQLKPEGKLVIPVGDRQSQKMMKITKAKNGTLIKEEFDHFSFVPLLGEHGWEG